ncbi:E3 ubiquitin-protein ligase Zswim2 [Sorochytrium milnesiophthora]
MSTATPAQSSSKPLPELVEQALASSFFIVQTCGPTKWILKDGTDQSVYKVSLGERHSCTCASFRGTCVHLVWTLNKRFKIPPTSELLLQPGLKERDISALMLMLDSQVVQTTRRGGDSAVKDKHSSGGAGSIEQRPIAEGDVCPICQESLLPEQQDSTASAITYCRHGCGNSIHLYGFFLAQRDVEQTVPESRVAALSSRDITDEDYDLLLSLDAPKHVQGHQVMHIVGRFPLHKLELPNVHMTDVSCIICEGKFIHGDVCRLLPCGHSKFHKDCIDRWLMRNSSTCVQCSSPAYTCLDGSKPMTIDLTGAVYIPVTPAVPITDEFSKALCATQATKERRRQADAKRKAKPKSDKPPEAVENLFQQTTTTDIRHRATAQALGPGPRLQFYIAATVAWQFLVWDHYASSIPKRYLQVCSSGQDKQGGNRAGEQAHISQRADTSRIIVVVPLPATITSAIY